MGLERLLPNQTIDEENVTHVEGIKAGYELSSEGIPSIHARQASLVDKRIKI
jgi:hypothetical protein